MGSAKTRAQNKYIGKTYDRVSLVLRKDSPQSKAATQAAADAAGESLNAYITTAIAERMKRESPADRPAGPSDSDDK